MDPCVCLYAFEKPRFFRTPGLLKKWCKQLGNLVIEAQKSRSRYMIWIFIVFTDACMIKSTRGTRSLEITFSLQIKLKSPWNENRVFNLVHISIWHSPPPTPFFNSPHLNIFTIKLQCRCAVLVLSCTLCPTVCVCVCVCVCASGSLTPWTFVCPNDAKVSCLSKLF